MTQQLVTPEEFSTLSTEAISWGRHMLVQLDTMDERVEQARHALTSMLQGRRVALQEASTPLSGCVVVTIDQHGPLRQRLVEQARTLRASGPLRRHGSALREGLVGSLKSADVKPAKGRFWNRDREDRSAEAVDRLRTLADWGQKTGYSSALDQFLATGGGPSGDEDELFALGLGYAAGVEAPRRVVPVSSADLRRLLGVAERGEHLHEVREDLTELVKSTYDQLRDRMVTRRLSEVPVSTIRDASEGKVRTIAPLEAAGFHSVQDILDRGANLGGIVGVSQQAAQQIRATASYMRALVKDDLRARIDLDEQDALLTELVSALHSLLDLEERVNRYRDEIDELVDLVAPLRAIPANDDGTYLLDPSNPRRGADLAHHLTARAAWVREVGLDSLLSTSLAGGAQGARAWDDFKKRSVTFYALLSEIVGIAVDPDAAQGHLPQEVVDAVNQQTLDTTRLKVSLRGYQAFGARYALVQRRVIVGDEMGLGKTVQALAAMAHLAANGARHFVVVCPPGVLLNWIKEIHRHSHLQALRVHGVDRDQTWRRWQRQGGVAVTSYGTLPRLLLEHQVDLLVVDEAHLIKNPAAQRTIAVNSYAESSTRVMLLTGTPLENKVEEFRNLIGYLQPEVTARLDSAEMVLGAHKFREAVSPVYLRRNSDDVLTELPELVEIEEYVALTDQEESAYINELAVGGFMAMRQVAFVADPEHSAKLNRLQELVDEAMANGKKVLVFSYFLNTLEVIADRLGRDVVAGTIRGSLSPDARQAMIDRFTESAEPRVLLSQIVAGGVGSNLQAASVVILCEPQVKPTLEDQAVKRAHRMGQLQSVQVHRLITPDSVDERLMLILAEKRRVFAEYAAMSEVAEVSPEAVSATDTEIIQRVIEEEKQRYAAQLRARLGDDSGARPSSRESGTDSVSGDLKDRPANGGQTSAGDGRSPQKLGRESTFDISDFVKDDKVEPLARREAPRPDATSRTVIPQCSACEGTYDINGHCRCS